MNLEFIFSLFSAQILMNVWTFPPVMSQRPRVKIMLEVLRVTVWMAMRKMEKTVLVSLWISSANLELYICTPIL